MTYVLYHGGRCQDGWASAYVAWRKFGDKAQYVPVQYNEPLPEIPDDSDIYILDFSYPREVLEKLWFRSRKVIILDHHATAEKELNGLAFASFQQRECGATMTWDFFFSGEEMPALLKHVRARDLWTWDQHKSREVNAALSIQERTFEHWDALFSYPIQDFIKVGEIVLEVQRRQVDSLVKKAYLANVGEELVPVVNSPILQSEIGEALCKGQPFAAIYFHKDEYTRIWSLRSDGNFDVGALAKSFGGGGHRAAAGFTERLD